MRVDNQPAFVLHARAWRETSLLLEVLTADHGRIGVVARGVRGPRARVARAQLEPFQQLSMDFSMHGELASLRGAEPTHAARPLLGEALLAGLYLNELVVRLCARQDPHPALYVAYAQALARLAASEPLAWTLRRFERDLLTALGYGMQLRHEGDSATPLEPDVDYAYLPEQGPVIANAPGGWRVRGSALLALDADSMPNAEDLRALRHLLRGLVTHHLGGAELRSWTVLRAALAASSRKEA